MFRFVCGRINADDTEEYAFTLFAPSVNRPIVALTYGEQAFVFASLFCVCVGG